MSRARTPPAAATVRWMEVNRDLFRERFNRASFEVAHHFSGHPLFELPRLMKLALTTQAERRNDFHYDVGDIRVEQRWDQVPERPFSAEEALERIETSGTWMILKNAQNDPDYREILEQSIAELKDLIGQSMRGAVKCEEIIIFITSPKRVTSYHIDRECNFILQIHGKKQISIFDQNDREVLTEEELEKFWSVDNNAAVYKPQYQNRAKVYLLAPGTGVHVPVNGPHWIQNLDNVSVTVSVNFQYRDTLRANAYRANYFLRRLGLTPTPPGRSPVKDAIKSRAMAGALMAYDLVRLRAPRR